MEQILDCRPSHGGIRPFPYRGGTSKDGHTVIEHVLGRPYGEEIERIEAAKKYTADSVERALETTVDKAMNEFNPKRGR
ncbi:MAG: hypothetical protein ACLUIQ_07330 [Dialister invisus]